MHIVAKPHAKRFPLRSRSLELAGSGKASVPSKRRNATKERADAAPDATYPCPLQMPEASPARHDMISGQGYLSRLTLAAPFDSLFPAQLVNNGIDLLDITVPHASPITNLPHHHRDPFDRLLIGQAIVEQMRLVSADSAFDAYPIQRLWS